MNSDVQDNFILVYQDMHYITCHYKFQNKFLLSKYGQILSQSIHLKEAFGIWQPGEWVGSAPGIPLAPDNISFDLNTLMVSMGVHALKWS